MNIYQLAIYGGTLAFTIIALQKKKWLQIENYVLLIGVLGGFLFSLAWEAKTRYIMPYFMIMIPYGVIGFSELAETLKISFKLTKAKLQSKRTSKGATADMEL